MFRFSTCALLLLYALAGGAATQVGDFASVTGQVLVNGRPAKAGDAVNNGDLLETKEHSAAKLLMLDKTVIDLGPSSTFRVSDYKILPGRKREVSVDMELGSVRALINKKLGKKGKFQIRTKSAVLAIRGTELVVVSGPEAKKTGDLITVLEGAISVSSLLTFQKCDLEAGSQLVASASGLSAPQALGHEALVAVKGKTQVLDQSLVQAVRVGADDPLSGRTTVASAAAALASTKATELSATQLTTPGVSRVPKVIRPPNVFPILRPQVKVQFIP